MLMFLRLTKVSFALWLSACASASNTSPDGSPTTERTTGGCRLALLPTHLPAPSTILDSTRLTNALAGDVPQVSNAAVSIVWHDAQVHVQVFRSDGQLSSETTEALQTAIQESVLSGQSTDEPFGLRLVLAGGRPVRTERVTYCPPKPNESNFPPIVTTETITARAEDMERIVSEMAQRSRNRQRFEARVSVNSAGRVTHVTVTRSTRNAEDDSTLERALRDRTFTPATIDNIPVTGVWVGSPLR